MQSGADRPLEGLKVLLMEDQEDVREILAILLRIAGAEVVEVADIEDGFASCQRDRLDCIIADLNIDHGGIKLLEMVRALDDPAARATPAIALTGHILAEDRAKALAAGFRTYLTKPVDPPVLVRAVADAVRDATSD